MNLKKFDRELINFEEDVEHAAAPIIKEIVFRVLKNNAGKPFPLKILRGCVEEATGKSYSHGSFSGAMRDLIEEKNGRIINIERGYYVYLKNFKHVQLKKSIDQLISSFDDIATDNILELTDEDIDTIRKIPLLKDQLIKMKKNLD